MIVNHYFTWKGYFGLWIVGRDERTSIQLDENTLRRGCLLQTEKKVRELQRKFPCEMMKEEKVRYCWWWTVFKSGLSSSETLRRIIY